MIQPLGVHIIVKKDAQPPLEVGGILIPECAERTPRFAPTILGTVLAVGGAVKIVRPGDRVALKCYCGDEIEYGNEQVTRLREKDLVGVTNE